MNEHAPPPPVEPVPGSAGALDIAMDAERHDPAPDSPARALLVDQGRLVRMQIAGERWGVALRALTAAAGLAVAAAVLALVLEARRADGLVIEAFSVPPSFAGDGITGQVLAAQLQDGLTNLQARTESSRAPETFSGAASGDVEVEIPQTGVSVGELRRFLRSWLGDETRVTGAVVRTAEGVRVITRVEGQPGDVVSGPVADLDRALAKASEQVFARTQPYRYGVYLIQNGRLGEARLRYQRLADSGPANEKPWALLGLALSADHPRDRARFARRALAVDPHLALARVNLAAAEQELGHEESALHQYRRAAEALQRRDRGGSSLRGAAAAGPNWRALAARAAGDHQTALRELEREAAAPMFPRGRVTRPARMATVHARLHDIGTARAMLGSATDDVAFARRLIAAGARLTVIGEAVMPNAIVAASAGDWATARLQLAALEAHMLRARGDELAAPRAAAFRTVEAPLLAVATARTGEVAESEARIARTPLDCYRCVIARGEIAALAGDAARADRWFAEAVRQGPSLPFAHAEWGRAKLARGDVAGAVPLLREAQRRGPRWADPWKFEGDALARQGKHRDAVPRYAAAAERAPRWGALHLAWGRSLEAMGRREEARRKYAQAARLDLSAADRAMVQRLLARRAT